MRKVTIIFHCDKCGTKAAYTANYKPNEPVAKVIHTACRCGGYMANVDEDPEDAKDAK